MSFKLFLPLLCILSSIAKGVEKTTFPVNAQIEVVAQSGIMFSDINNPRTEMSSIPLNHGTLAPGAPINIVSRTIKVVARDELNTMGSNVTWSLLNTDGATGTTGADGVIRNQSVTLAIAGDSLTTALTISDPKVNPIVITSTLPAVPLTKTVGTYRGISLIKVVVQ